MIKLFQKAGGFIERSYAASYTRLLWIMVIIATASCSDEHPKPLPVPPSKLEVVTEKVPVPVLCKATVSKSSSPLDNFALGQPLEVQNATLRSTIASLSGYIKRLEGAVVGCGGTIAGAEK